MARRGTSAGTAPVSEFTEGNSPEQIPRRFGTHDVFNAFKHQYRERLLAEERERLQRSGGIAALGGGRRQRCTIIAGRTLRAVMPKVPRLAGRMRVSRAVIDRKQTQ